MSASLQRDTEVTELQIAEARSDCLRFRVAELGLKADVAVPLCPSKGGQKTSPSSPIGQIERQSAPRALRQGAGAARLAAPWRSRRPRRTATVVLPMQPGPRDARRRRQVRHRQVAEYPPRLVRRATLARGRECRAQARRSTAAGRPSAATAQCPRARKDRCRPLPRLPS